MGSEEGEVAADTGPLARSEWQEGELIAAGALLGVEESLGCKRLGILPVLGRSMERIGAHQHDALGRNAVATKLVLLVGLAHDEPTGRV